MASTLDSALSTRLREILASGNVTEAELREVTEQADGWARTLRAQIRASERKLRTLAADPASPISEIADELRRVERFRPQLAEARRLLAGLEIRARELRTEWLRRQTGSPGSAGSARPRS